MPSTEILLAATNLLLVPTLAWLWTIGGRLARIEAQVTIMLRWYELEMKRRIET